MWPFLLQKYSGHFMINFMLQLFIEGTTLSCEVTDSREKIDDYNTVEQYGVKHRKQCQGPKLDWWEDPEGSQRGTAQGLFQELPRRVTRMLRPRSRRALPTGVWLVCSLQNRAEGQAIIRWQFSRTLKRLWPDLRPLKAFGKVFCGLWQESLLGGSGSHPGKRL